MNDSWPAQENNYYLAQHSFDLNPPLFLSRGIQDFILLCTTTQPLTQRQVSCACTRATFLKLVIHTHKYPVAVHWAAISLTGGRARERLLPYFVLLFFFPISGRVELADTTNGGLPEFFFFSWTVARALLQEPRGIRWAPPRRRAQGGNRGQQLDPPKNTQTQKQSRLSSRLSKTRSCDHL